MGLLNKSRTQCREFRFQLEDAASFAPGAKELPELFSVMPAALQAHASSCLDCRAAGEEFLAVRALMTVLPPRAASAGPWFVPRVMAAIAARGAGLSRTPDTWTFLPKLAARLTWASAIALLLASGWLYQAPASTSTNPAVVTDITGEPLVSNAAPANNDEVLVSLAEKPR